MARKLFFTWFFLSAAFVSLQGYTCGGPVVGPGECLYEGQIYKNGASFASSDGCNTCGCSQGAVQCTLKACQSKDSCTYEGKIYKDGASFPAADGCNKCTCSKGSVGCTEMGCSSSCTYDSKTYKDGDSFPSTDGCNTCSCSGGQVVCTQKACATACGSRGLPPCPSAHFCSFAIGECGAADKPGTCSPKPEACTQQYQPVCGCDNKTYGNSCDAASAGVSILHDGECKSSPTSCLYEGQTYKDGESFPASDGCNKCFCKAGAVSCTEMACGNQCGGIAGITCPKSEFCDYGSHCGATDQMGSCKPLPQACTDDYTPVCGCDGKTYSNRCNAHASGVSVQFEGECKPAPGSCSYNGQTYKEGESFPAADGCNTCTCSNGNVGCTKIACKSCGSRGLPPCSKGEFCNQPSHCGATDIPGACLPLPTACNRLYDPVCGCDNQTYSNECSAHSSGVSVLHKGECKTPTSCTYNGQTYKDGSSFPAGDGCNTCTCKGGVVGCTKIGCSSVCGGIAGLQCARGEFCSYAPGTCNVKDRSGTCKLLPPPSSACPAVYDPVCACGGKTYGNSCEAEKAGASIDYKGECKSTGLSCTHNGKTYKDGESFPAGDGCNTCSCSNGVVRCSLIPVPCQPKTCGGIAGLSCASGEFCEYPIGTCNVADRSGTCKALPPPGSVCPAVYDPVCSCNGKTYSNACEAEQGGASIDYKGVCRTTGSCLYNGQSYVNGASFPAGDGCNTCTCQNAVVSCTKIACPKQCTSIQSTNVCSSNEFCNYAEGTCFARTRVGVCEVVPTTCTMIYKPVCGCDGKTYSNACHAAAAKMTIDYQGACTSVPPPPPAP